MDDIGHSSLLKFLVKDTMSEKNIESKVPGEHNLREVSNEEIDIGKETLFSEDKAQSASSVSIDKANQSLSEANTSENATVEDFTLSPVITVTKKEATFTKGDLKLQKVTVTEDISHTSINNEGGEEKFNRRLTYEIHSSSTQHKNDVISNSSKEREAMDPKRLKTKIPMARLRQVVNRVKNDIREKKRLEREKDTPSSSRKSSIPRLKDSKIPQLKETQIIKKENLITSQADEEFDRIFQELNPTEDNSLEFINTDIENMNEVEDSFDEIIHAYEDKTTQSSDTDKTKQSRIPLLKRKSEHEIEVSKEKQTLKKNMAIDTSNLSSKREAKSERIFTTGQIEQNTQKTTEKRKVRKESQNYVAIDTNTGNIVDTIVYKDDTRNQESNKAKESVKVAIPVFDIQLTEKKLKRNDSDIDDINQEITISKNLNFDKETVSKIYKIDFTENNFDSIDVIDKTTLINENSVAQTSQIKTNIDRTLSMESTKTIERINNIALDVPTSINQVEAHKTEENNITTGFLIESDKTTKNLQFSEQNSVKDISFATNKIVETKTSNITSKTLQCVKNESETVAFDNVQASVRLVSLEGTANKNIETSKQSKILNKENMSTEELLDINKIEFDTNNIKREVSRANNITQTKNNTILESIDFVNVEGVENKEQRLIDNCKSVEFGTKRQVLLETNTADNKTTQTRERSVEINDDENIQTSVQRISMTDKNTEEKTNNARVHTSTQNVKINEKNKDANYYHLINKTGNIEFDSSVKKVSLETEKIINTKDITKSLESIQSKKIRERSKIEEQRHLVNESENIDPNAVQRHLVNKNENIHSSDIQTLIKANTLNEETLVKSKTSEKRSKMDELLRKYENIEYDESTSIKEILRETSIENKNRNKDIVTENSVKTDATIVNEHSDISKSLNDIIKKDINTENTISTSENIENKPKETLTNANKEFLFKEISKYSNTYQQNINSSNEMSSNNPLNDKLVTQVREETKNTNITQNKEDKYKIYSDVFTKMNATQKQSHLTKTNEVEQNNKTNEAEQNNKTNEVNRNIKNEEDITILKGKVERVVKRINSIDNKPVEKKTNELPKKKSILSKIEMFERGEPDEIYPRGIPKINPLTSRLPLRQTSTELRKPKIVKEIFKATKYDKANVKENTESIKIERQYSTDKIRVDNTKLSDKVNNTFVKDVDKEFNKVINNKNDIEKTNKDTTDTNLRLSNQNSFDKTNINEWRQTEVNVDRDLSSQYVKQSYDSKNKLEIVKNDDTNKIYTKIYSNNDAEKTLNSNKYEITNNEEDKLNKEENEDVFNSTPMDGYKEISNTDNNITAKSEHRIVSDCESKSLTSLNSQNYEYIRSVEKLESDKDGKECMRRAISVAELEIGGVVKGRVHEMIMRINSMEMLSQGKKELILTIEEPRKSSVTEKIALFEGKLPVKSEKKKESFKMKNETVRVDNKDYTKKITELTNVKNNYVNISTEFLELRDGSLMPAIALGTALLDKPLIRHVVEAAIDMGYRAIDTAYIYGNEKEIGEAINNKINDGTVKREELYIISKLWSTYHRRDLVERACKQSLQNMGLTYFDLYLIHNPMSLLEGGDPLPKIANVLQYSEHDYMEAWCGIEDLVLKGLVRRGGVSNFNSEQVHRVMEKGRLKPVVNQVECHPYLSQERLGGFCDAYGMRLSCYGVLGSKGTPAEHKSDLPPVIDDPLVLVMAAGLGVSPGQMLVAYQLHNGRSVVIKATSAAHLYDNLKAQFISLEPTHLTALKSLNKNKRTYYLKGLGETHKNYPFNIAF